MSEIDELKKQLEQVRNQNLIHVSEINQYSKRLAEADEQISSISASLRQHHLENIRLDQLTTILRGNLERTKKAARLILKND